jgi:hypothetical protein
VIADENAFADKRMTLDAAALADMRITLYLDKGADKTMVANRASIQIHRLHHCCVLAKQDVVRDPRLFKVGLHSLKTLE